MVESNLRIAFWGTSRFSVFVLDELARDGFVPALIVTAPPKPKGRGMALSPSLVKVWADSHNIPTIEPNEIKSESFLETLGKNWDLFIVASYGKIISRRTLDLPKHGTLNVHPSLLPKLRGSTPLQSAILEDISMGEPHTTGTTIMLIDEEVDHGPLVAQGAISISNWPPKESELEETLGVLGGALLAKTIPEWIRGDITPIEQNHHLATYTKKITKTDALVDLESNPQETLRKIRAFNVWPRAYFITMRSGKETRVIITSAHLEGGEFLVLDRVIPEGKREMSYSEFLRGQQ
jgi:methionyl-tRNA formyltransferase